MLSQKTIISHITRRLLLVPVPEIRSLWRSMVSHNFSIKPVLFESIIDFEDYWIKNNGYIIEKSDYDRLPATIDKYLGWYELTIYFHNSIHFKPLSYITKTYIDTKNGLRIIQGYPYELEYYTTENVYLDDIKYIEYSYNISGDKKERIKKTCKDYGLDCSKIDPQLVDIEGILNRIVLNIMREIGNYFIVSRAFLTKNKVHVFLHNITSVQIALLWDKQHGFISDTTLLADLVFYENNIVSLNVKIKELTNRYIIYYSRRYGVYLDPYKGMIIERIKKYMNQLTNLIKHGN